MRSAAALTAVALAVAIFAPACGSHGSAASGSTATTLSPSAAASAYEAAADKGNAALSAMVTRLDALGAVPIDSAVAAAVDPAIPALTQYENTLSHIGWPSRAASTDAHGVVEAVAALVEVLQSAGQPNGGSVASFETKLSSATSQAGMAADLLRNDLGLPPSSATTAPPTSVA